MESKGNSTQTEGEHSASERTSFLKDKVVSRSQGQIVMGILSAFSSVILSVASKVCVQLLDRRIPDLELNAFRTALPVLLYSVWIVAFRQWPVVDRAGISPTLWYSAFIFTHSLCIFAAVSFLPLATVHCVKYTIQLPTGIIIFHFLWKEKITAKMAAAVFLCLAGVVLVIQPWEYTNKHQGSPRIANSSEEAKTTDENPSFNVTVILGYALSIFTGLLSTIGVLALKRSDFIQDNMLRVMFWVYISNTVASIVLMLPLEHVVVPESWFDMAMVLGHSLVFAFYWPTLLYACTNISGNSYNNIASTVNVFMLICQYTVLSDVHPGHRNWIEIVGVLLVTFGSAFSSVTEICHQKNQDKKDQETTSN